MNKDFDIERYIYKFHGFTKEDVENKSIKYFLCSTLIQLPEDKAVLTEEAGFIADGYLERTVGELTGYRYDMHPKNYGYIRTKEQLMKTRYATTVKNDPDNTFYWENYFIFPCTLDRDTIDSILVEAVEKVYEFLRPKTEYVHISSYTRQMDKLDGYFKPEYIEGFKQLNII